jgi:hypothetical protein
MKAKSSLSLPMPKELTSNKLEDIQEHFRKINEAIDKQYKLLWQDTATIQVAEDGFIYFGGKDVDGSWRVGRDETNVDGKSRWEMQRRELGTYVGKGAATE